VAKQGGIALGRLKEQVRFVADRPGHDRRYAIDTAKVRRETGWRPRKQFADGIEETVAWYLAHRDWTDSVTSGAYQSYYDSVYKKLWDHPA
jgi:dTDP-glucose 4,6-dehydratase